jgi:hypothetical protein
MGTRVNVGGRLHVRTFHLGARDLTVMHVMCRACMTDFLAENVCSLARLDIYVFDDMYFVALATVISLKLMLVVVIQPGPHATLFQWPVGLFRTLDFGLQARDQNRSAPKWVWTCSDVEITILLSHIFSL